MNTWGDKRYYSFDYYLKETFGEKLYKISLNGGMTFPNRDGTKGSGGCIFCSAGGSGDFAADRRLSIKEQIAQGKERVRQKYTGSSYIAYFQAFTNTYAPISYLRDIFTEAISEPEIKVLSIATRPDCLSEEILSLLAELNEKKPVWVELGLQTIHPETAEFIRRGYTLDVFEKAVYDLKKIGIHVIVHTLLCLPGETTERMLETMDYLNALPIDGVKLQLLHVLKGTDLASIYEDSPFYLPTLEEYVELLGKIVARLRSNIVIHRLTGDGPKSILIAPLWTGNKRLVLGTIQKYMKEADIWQGKETACQNHLHCTN